MNRDYIENNITVNILLGKEKNYNIIFDSLSEYNKNYSYRVANYVSYLYEKAIEEGLYKEDKSMNSEFIPFIREIVCFFDIGKVLIPSDVANIIDNLSPCDEKIFKKHPTKSMIIYKNITESMDKDDPKMKYINLAYDIARFHHENYDGSGYPKGLVGNDTPALTRLVRMIIDYDRITSMRYYVPSYSHNYALNEINHYSGVWYDPLFVKLLNKNTKQINDMNNQFKKRAEKVLIIDAILPLIARDDKEKNIPYWWFDLSNYTFFSSYEFCDDSGFVFDKAMYEEQKNCIPFIEYDYLQFSQKFVDKHLKIGDYKGKVKKFNQDNIYMFKELLIQNSLEKEWKEFEEDLLREMAVKWCKENNIEYTFNGEYRYIKKKINNN